jgi:hypothetical protein
MHSVFGAIVAVGSTAIAYSLYSYCLLAGVDEGRNTAWSKPLNPWLILSIDFVLNDIGITINRPHVSKITLTLTLTLTLT